MGGQQGVTIVTFNVRGVMDRWPERAPVLRECLSELNPDVVAFQEVLTGEFGQDKRLLGPSYTVYGCRAALANLEVWGGATAACVSAVQSLLRFRPTRDLLVSLPEWVEAWREYYRLRGDWARGLRDLAMAPFFGNSIASRLPVDAASARLNNVLVLGGFRAAQRVRVLLPATAAPGAAPQRDGSEAHLGGSSPQQGAHGTASAPPVEDKQPLALWVVNTHLDHADPAVRAEQGEAVAGWMDKVRGDGSAGVVITGDLNAPPSEEVHHVLWSHGYQSANKAAHGHEPERTWPSGLIAPLMDEGYPHCADYVYVWQAPGYSVRVLSAELCGDQPAPHDGTLYPSDHVAVSARLAVAAMQAK